MRSITILDKDYLKWVETLISRYQQSQVLASVRVNAEQLRFNFLLGRDIVEMHVEERWGEGVIAQLSKDLKKEMPTAEGLSVTNLRYCRRFYLLYSEVVVIRPQVEGEIGDKTLVQIHPQAGGKFTNAQDSQKIPEIFCIPWGHHKLILDKVKGDVTKALFCGLAQEMTKDPYNFAFAGVTKRHNEAELKLALLKNITDFLVELGKGFAYVGREYRLEIGQTENFIDLLFYNLRLRCYVVIEVKIGKFVPADIGQIGSYIVAVNHQLREEGKDNPTIGLLICRSKDNTQAQYALESSSQPIGISEYELERFYPEKVEGTIPSIEEIEGKRRQSKSYATSTT